MGDEGTKLQWYFLPRKDSYTLARCLLPRQRHFLLLQGFGLLLRLWNIQEGVDDGITSTLLIGQRCVTGAVCHNGLESSSLCSDDFYFTNVGWVSGEESEKDGTVDESLTIDVVRQEQNLCGINSDLLRNLGITLGFNFGACGGIKVARKVLGVYVREDSMRQKHKGLLLYRSSSRFLWCSLHA